jgi:hypothetical protein
MRGLFLFTMASPSFATGAVDSPPRLINTRPVSKGLHYKEVRDGRDSSERRDPASVYQNIVRKYGLETGLSAEVMGLCVHSLRATAATNALSHDSDIAKVQE